MSKTTQELIQDYLAQGGTIKVLPQRAETVDNKVRFRRGKWEAATSFAPGGKLS